MNATHREHSMPGLNYSYSMPGHVDVTLGIKQRFMPGVSGDRVVFKF